MAECFLGGVAGEAVGGKTVVKSSEKFGSSCFWNYMS